MRQGFIFLTRQSLEVSRLSQFCLTANAWLCMIMAQLNRRSGEAEKVEIPSSKSAWSKPNETCMQRVLRPSRETPYGVTPSACRPGLGGLSCETNPIGVVGWSGAQGGIMQNKTPTTKVRGREENRCFCIGIEDGIARFRLLSWASCFANSFIRSPPSFRTPQSVFRIPRAPGP